MTLRELIAEVKDLDAEFGVRDMRTGDEYRPIEYEIRGIVLGQRIYLEIDTTPVEDFDAKQGG